MKRIAALMDRRDARALAVALGVVAIVQSLWFVQIGPIDPVNYWEFSLHPRGHVVDGLSTTMLPNHGATRMGIVIPLFAASHTLGTGLVAYHAVALAHAVLLVVATYFAARALFSLPVAAVSAAAVGTMYPVLTASTQVLPDNLGTAWLVTSIALALRVKDSAWIARLAGLAFGIGYLSREEQIVLGPLVLAMALLSSTRSRGRAFADFAGGALAVVALEAVALTSIFGSPLARLTSILAHGDGTDPQLLAYGEGATVLTVLKRGPQVIATSHIGLVVLVSLVAAGLLALRAMTRRRMSAWTWLAVWAGMWWAYIVIMAGLFDPTHPALRDNQLRYWSQLMPAGIIAASALAFGVVRWVASRISAASSSVAAVVMTAALIGAPIASDMRLFNGQTAWIFFKPTPMSQTGAYLATAGDSVTEIWMPYRATRLAYFFVRDPWGRVRWHGDLKRYDGKATAEETGLPLLHYSYALNRGKLDLPIPAQLHRPDARTLLGDCATGFCLLAK